MRSNKLHCFLIFIFSSAYCFADYAWIPDYHHLNLKFGGEYFTSSENYASDGTKSVLLVAGQPSAFNEYRFGLEGEYSFAKDWSGLLKIPFVSNLIDSPGATPFSGSGLGDLTAGLKWNFLRTRLLLTGELYTNLPLYSTSDLSVDYLVLGDGSIDLGGKIHLGYRFNRQFAFGISPGLVARSLNYSSAFTLTAFAGATWNPIYLRFILENFSSLSSDPNPVPTELNSATGSGGSFARLSYHPNVFSLGGKFGYFAGPKYRIEGTVMWSAMGSYSPTFFRGGLALVADFDLYNPDPPKTRIKEIPFETEQKPFEEKSEDLED
ncbi:MAG: hypothetical protein FJ112_10610 [Deltaproteobacteria bacterium]|nr:hypothetical protein [Deltaproteobacteria bacterium]